MKRSARFTALFTLLIFALSMPNLLPGSIGHVRFVSGQGQSETSVRHKVIGCAKEPRGECVGDECNCSKWIIEWRDPAGRVWGVSEAKTLQKLIEARDRDLAFERAYATFFRVPFDQKFANPSQPICDGCRPSDPSNATRSATAAIQTAASLYDEWTRKVAEGMLSLTNVIFGRQTTTGFRNAGSVLKDYANALRLVNANLKHLRQNMSFTERERGRLTGNLESTTAELRQATDVMTTAYANLPSEVRNALEGRSSPADLRVRASGNPGNGEIESTFDGQFVTVTFKETEGYWRQGSLRASIAAIDVDASKVDASDMPSLTLICKNNAECFNGYVRANGRPSSENHISYGAVYCSSVSECEAFLRALKEAARQPE